MCAFYQCIICHHANISIMDLHNHHVEHHNAKELSQTIISLNGFRVYNGMEHMKEKYLQPANIGDKNNNEDLYNHVFVKPAPKNYNAHNGERLANSPRKFSHDENMCSKNCSQFIPWEHELNKRTEINDEEFFNVIESLCCDLSKRKRRGRKKKHKTDTERIDTGNVEQQVAIETMNRLSTEPTQATTSFWNNQDRATSTITSNNVLPVQREIKLERAEYNEAKTKASNNTVEKDKDATAYDSLCNNFSWSSIIFGDIDEDADEGNIYTKSMEPTIENLLS